MGEKLSRQNVAAAAADTAAAVGVDAAAAADVVAVLARLVAIDSVNPAFPGGKIGEAGVVRFLADYFDQCGIAWRTVEVLPGRPNLIACLPGKTRAGLCFEAHMDTVTAEGMSIPPFEPVVAAGRLFGRGSCDTKGSLAAMACALSWLKKNQITPATDIYLAAVIDEELQYRGVTNLLADGFQVQAAVIGEPTGLKVVPASKGVCRFVVETRGKAGHSSRPSSGHNAIYDMAAIISEIENGLVPELNQRLHPLLGSPTISVGVIEGGALVNIIPDRCRIQIDRRMLPGEDFASVPAEIGAIISKLKKNRPLLDAVIEPPLVTDYALDTPLDAAIVRCAAAACRHATGSGQIIGMGFGSDASKFSRAGIPAIILGPGDIQNAHAAVEYVDIAELEAAVRIYADLCLSFADCL